MTDIKVMSQTFKDTPDINPVKIYIHFEGACGNRQGLHGVLISSHIGVKVFLSTFSLIFGFNP